MKQFLVLSAATLLALSPRARSNDVVPDGFDHAVTFTVRGYEAGKPALADFPVLVRISEAAIAGFRYDHMGFSTGEDLCFVAADGTPLAFEVDTWDTNATSLAWVRLPSMTNGTQFLMCYGSDTSVVAENPWSAYTAVWHMDEEDGAVADATGNGLAATPGGNYTNNSVSVPGIIGNARQNAISGQPGNLTVSDYDSQSVGGVFTVSGWFNMTEDGSSDNRLFSRKSKSGVEGGWEAFARKNGGRIIMRGNTTGSSVESASNLALAGQGWKHFAFVFDGTSGTIYVDGSPFASSGSLVEPTDNGEPLGIGAYNVVGTTSFYGSVDECRLVKGASSADWIAADYATQSSPSFLSNGGAKAVRPAVLLVVGERGSAEPDPGAGPWFDAGVDSLENWPTDGSDLAVGETGTWTGTTNATLVAARHALTVDAPDGGMVAFVPSGSRTATADVQVSFLSTATVTGIAPSDPLAPSDRLVPPAASAKGALAVAKDGTGAARYYGWAKDPGGPTNAWIALAGATPVLDVPVSLRIAGKFDGGLSVRYEADGAVLSAGGDDWLPVAAESGTFDYAGMAGGNFEVSSLAAGTLGGTVSVTIPELPENVSVASVATNGVEVVPVEGVYTVRAGDSVVVTFGKPDGFVFVGSPTLVLTPFADVVVPLASVPEAVDPRSLVRINEIMASNPSPNKGGLATEKGLAELDWIELRNTTSVDVDVSGWYLSDDATKPTKRAILGTCVVPANGYKVVWCTKDYAEDAASWNETEGRARLNLSSSGENLSLADPQGVVVDRVDFTGKQQIKGYTYGPGTVSHGPNAGKGPCVYMKTATPGAENVAEGWDEPTPEVAFSAPHGYYTTNIVVELSCPTAPTNEIWYTLDGSSPAKGAAASRLYDANAPIAVSRTTVLRAAVPDAGSVLQMDTARTYIYLDDVLAQGRTTTAPTGIEPYFPNSGAVNGQTLRYGMLQSVVDDAESRERLLRGFTNTIATISVVVDPQNLFNSSTGIYVNPRGEGESWERQIMLEQIDPLAADGGGFGVPAGIRIRGGNSRNTSKPKHSLRFFFRSSYGKSSLDFPLFGDEGVDEFDKVDLRTSQNLSWANENSTLDTFVTEVFSRDAQRDLGQPYTRSRYYNLFLNGQYWGLYQTQERADEHWGESYLGGDSLKFDLVKTASTYVNGKLTYSIECNEGTWDAWDELRRIATEEGFGGVHSNNYKRVLGLDPDGVRNPDYPVLLNAGSLMAYMLVSHYVVDKDGPTSPFSSLDKGHANNFYAIRNRDDDGTVKGFVFLRHDAELSMGIDGNYTVASRDPTFWGTEAQTNPAVGSPDPSGLGAEKFKTLAYFTPAELHYRLMQNPDYARAYADLFDRECLREGGALTVGKSTERYLARMAEIDDAIVCEQARWANNGQTRSTWLQACKTSVTFVTNRIGYMKDQYRLHGWYPSVETPRACDAAGTVYTNNAVVPNGESVRFDPVPAGGAVYYTLDGSDPLANGVLSATALAYDPATGFALPLEGATVRARAVAEGAWSALEEVKLASEPPETVPLRDALRVAALYTSTSGDGDTGEFVVLTNLSAEASVVLSGGRLVAWNAKKQSEAKPSLSIPFEGTTIAPGGSLTLPQTAFGGGKLTNSQVGLRIYDATNGLVQDVFVDADWWNAACDGTGEWFLAKDLDNVATNRVQWRPTATSLPGRLAVSALYTSTSGDGDTGEFIALTNLDATASIDLSDVRIVAWNAKKKTEADPSLAIVLDGTSVAQGGTATLDQATFFGSGKLTNSQVGLRIYDPAGALVQECFVDADWWEKACDGTGRWFVAQAFRASIGGDRTAPLPEDWAPSPEPRSDIGTVIWFVYEGSPENFERSSRTTSAAERSCGG